MENTIKLTVRLPATLHSRLRHRARENHLSLNQTIIEVIQRGLDSEPFGEMLSERERVLKDVEDWLEGQLTG